MHEKRESDFFGKMLSYQCGEQPEGPGHVSGGESMKLSSWNDGGSCGLRALDPATSDFLLCKIGDVLIVKVGQFFVATLIPSTSRRSQG